MTGLTIDGHADVIEEELEDAQNELSDHAFDMLLQKVFNVVVELKNRYYQDGGADGNTNNNN